MALMDSSGRFLFGDFSFSSFQCPNCTCVDDDPSCLRSVPPPDSDSDNTATQTKIKIQHPSHLLPGFLIAAGALLAVSFLVFLTFYAVLKRRRRLRRQSLALPPPPPPQEDGDGADAAGDGQGGSTHHIWLIRTVGLDESIIGSIATTVYKSRHGTGGDCTVCLGEFKDGEMVKLLPRCTHPFHVSCIDTWLRSHVNCPLCRAPVVLLATDHIHAEEDDASRNGLDSHVDVPFSCISLDTEPEAVAASSSTSSSSSSSSSELPKEMKDNHGFESSSSSSSSSELPKEMEDNHGFQPARRSVSMDASSLVSLLRKAEQAEIKGYGENPRMELDLSVVSDNKGKQGTASLRGKRSLVMKRSQSTRSGRFFFPRYGCGRNPILPL